MRETIKKVQTRMLHATLRALLKSDRSLNRDALGKTDNHIQRLSEEWSSLLLSTASNTNHPEEDIRAFSRSLMLHYLPPESWGLMPTFEKRQAPVMNTWSYQNQEMDWGIGDGELVLDVGCGGWPFQRANHLADKFPEQTSHRVEALARDERPFFQVDLENLPFENNSYDFVFCSHVLEHLDRPGQAIRELTRIGRRGYIEVPTRLSDVLFNFTRLPNHHRWHGMIQGGTFVLVEWNDWERKELGNYFFDSLQSEYHNPFQDFFERNRDMFFASCRWEGALKFLILDKQGQVIDSSEH